jgi:hypothetical protein
MTERGRSFPSFTLMHDGPVYEHHGPLMLERRRGEEWIEVARYGTGAEASEALDELLADGTDADHLRFRRIGRRRIRT